MKVRHKRLAKLLMGHGFTSVSRSQVSHGWTFVRPSHINELFESIIVESQGKRNEAVYASVGLAVTQTVTYKELGDVQLLEELAEEPQRGWTIIDDDSKAKLWEQKLAAVGPVRAAQLAETLGKQLLQSTAPLRAIVKKYSDCLSRQMPLSQSLGLLKRNCNSEFVMEAQRLVDCPLFESEGLKALCYQLACHVISCNSATVESRSFIGHDPEYDIELLDRIELLADRLLQLSAGDKSKLQNLLPNRSEDNCGNE